MTDVHYKVVHTDGWIAPFIKEERDELNKIGAELVITDCKTEDEVIKACKDADGIINISAPITRRVIESLHRCKVISKMAIGYDNIDVKAATDYGIIVTNVPDFCIEEVSNHAITFLLACAKKLTMLNNGMRQGRWDHFPQPLVSIYGQTLGLVGCGRIGLATAAKAHCFGLKLLGYDPYIDKSVAKENGIALVSLHDLLSQSDFVSVHTPLTAETRHMIGEKEFRLMKPSAFFINTCRGPVIDEQALIKALGKKMDRWGWTGRI